MRYNPEAHPPYSDVHQALSRHDFVTAKRRLEEEIHHDTDLNSRRALQGLSLYCLEQALQPKNEDTNYPEGKYFLRRDNNSRNEEADYFLYQTRNAIWYDEPSQDFRPSHAVDVMNLQLQHPDSYSLEDIIATMEIKLTAFESEKKGRDKKTKIYLNGLLQVGQVLSLFSEAFLEQERANAQLEEEAQLQMLAQKAQSIVAVPPEEEIHRIFSYPGMQKISLLSRAIFTHVYQAIKNQQEKNRELNLRRKRKVHGPYFDTLAGALLTTNTQSSNGIVEYLLHDPEFAATFEQQEGFKKWKEEQMREMKRRQQP